MGNQWQSVSLPPCPIRRQTPEERAEQTAMMDAHIARYLHGVELRAKRKGRTTEAQRARKAAQDETRKLHALLREAAEASRWERITAALDVYGMQAWGAKEKAAKLRDKVNQRTAKVYAKAAAGCIVSAEFIADEAADELYREAFTVSTGSLQQ